MDNMHVNVSFTHFAAFSSSAAVKRSEAARVRAATDGLLLTLFTLHFRSTTALQT